MTQEELASELGDAVERARLVKEVGGAGDHVEIDLVGQRAKRIAVAPQRGVVIPADEQQHRCRQFAKTRTGQIRVPV